MYGTLIVEPFVSDVVRSLLQDQQGNVCNVRLVLENVKAEMYASGTKLAILNPTLRDFGQGGRGIVVDAFENIEVIDCFPPEVSLSVPEQLKQEGNQHYGVQEYEKSIDKYTRALEGLVETNGFVASCMLTLSLAYSKSGRCWDAIVWAAAALRFSPNNVERKAYYRIAVESRSFGDYGLALFSAERALAVAPAEDKITNLVDNLRRRKSSAESPVKSLDEFWVRLRRLVNTCSSLVLWKDLRRSSTLFPAKSPEEFKSEADQVYASGYFSFAILPCMCAIIKSTPMIPLLLSNRAACLLNVGQIDLACIDALTALLFNPFHEKAHIRRIKSYIMLFNAKEADMAWGCARSFLPESAMFAELRKEIDELKPSPVVSSVAAKIPQANQQSDTEGEEDLIAKMERLLKEKPGALSEYGIKLNNKLPPFHTEFITSGLCPPQLEVDVCKKKLSKAYETARLQPLKKMIIGDVPQVDKKEVKNALENLHRINDEVGRKWLFTENNKDVFFHSVNVNDENVLRSFSNVPRRPWRYDLNTVHVSVGFVDLGDLLTCDLVHGPAGRGALHWIGVDMSAYPIAKTAVISRMMRQRATTNAIFQVWFSSTWSKDTLKAFRLGVEAVLADGCPNSREVVALLKHWKQASVSAAVAVKSWFAMHSSSLSTAADVLDTKDRNELIQYLLTGSLGEGADVGSVVMYGSVPNSSAAVAHEECFLQSIYFPELMNCRKQTKSFVEAGTIFWTMRIAGFTEVVARNIVQIEFIHAKIEPSAPVIAQIRSFKPHSIHWNNMCDYMKPKEFFDVARACSTDDTNHYGFSKYWPAYVKKSFLMDHCIMSLADASYFRDMFTCAESLMKSKYKKNKWDTFLRVPSAADPFKAADHSMQIRKIEKWMDAFTSFGPFPNKHAQVACTSMETFNVFSDTNAAIDTWFTFNVLPDGDAYERAK